MHPLSDHNHTVLFLFSAIFYSSLLDQKYFGVPENNLDFNTGKIFGSGIFLNLNRPKPKNTQKKIEQQNWGGGGTAEGLINWGSFGRSL